MHTKGPNHCIPTATDRTSRDPYGHGSRSASPHLPRSLASMPNAWSNKVLAGVGGGSTASKTHEAKAELALGYFRAYSYYSRTGETTTTSDPSTATLLHIRLPRQNSASTETSRAGEEITWGPGLRACKGPLIRGRPMSLLPPGIPHAAVPWR
jgi:hypothetical protein